MKTTIMRRFRSGANSKKGFTLVEVIVVLVILAILMAIAVPALTGYIGKARDGAAKGEAKTALTAAQTYVTEKGYRDVVVLTTGTVPTLATLNTEVATLTGDSFIGDGDLTKAAIIEATIDASGRITVLKYKTSDARTATYDPATKDFTITT
jgi:type IV pilus assembly protein PilA